MFRTLNIFKNQNRIKANIDRTATNTPSVCGQVIMEFTFCVTIVLLMIYGSMMIFRWAGLDLAERRIAHDRLLSTNTVVQDYGGCLQTINGICTQLGSRYDGPLKQLDPYFYKPIDMNTVLPSN